MKTKDAYTELAIQIATLDMKLNKILELLNKPEITIKPFIEILPEDIERARELFKDLESTTDHDLTKPCQWPNESHIDYLKRIGQYNEASNRDAFAGSIDSEDEKFLEDFK